jgi:glycosyltransferase involved in cell wall biosynthesis
MSRNLLPFEDSERRRYGLSWMNLKLLMLRRRQTKSFRYADGVIFLNEYAHSVVLRHARSLRGSWTIIPHGVGRQFLHQPRPQKPISAFTVDEPLRLLYVSIVDVYKHQRQVAEAVSSLRSEGLPVELEMVGPAYTPALRRLNRRLSRLDPSGEFLRYTGPVPSGQLPGVYHKADLAIFASSCENMPNILLESMAAGLPIACSSRGPMPSILGEAGVYFDPERPDEIAAGLRTLIENPQLRQEKSQLAYKRAQEYTWEKCAQDTFAFIAQIGGAIPA